MAVVGCSYLGSARDFDPAEFSRDPRWVRVGDIPLILQRAEHDCGAATVAMVLAHWDRIIPFERLIEGLPKDYRQRYSTEDLKKLLESHGLRARMIAGSQDILFAELSKGRPTIVGLGKVSIDGAHPHFEVVVAYHPVENRVVTLDPARGWRENALSGFMDEWDLAKRTQIVAYEMQ
jgi:ABC-type bacteriocin/lantibiotic exporter with double-glycine peptidase domain